jgi:hypothetical protein
MGVTVMVSSGDDGVAADPRYCNFDSSSNAYDTWTVRTILLYCLLPPPAMAFTPV